MPTLPQLTDDEFEQAHAQAAEIALAFLVSVVRDPSHPIGARIQAAHSLLWFPREDDA